ncbi:MAG: hypothetical protein GX434_07810 [Peptococcaceae bacterium]|nr:hypothetical protein [Peptococcaceae bacterium]
MLLYISIILMLAGIIATFIISKKPQRVVIWSIVTAIVLQSLSFLLFSGIVHKNAALLWVGTGLAIGAIFGFFIKLERKDRNIFYRQNIIFALSFLVLLLVNQFIALLFKSYIPIMLFIAALAVGMQVGLNLVIVLKAKKLRKEFVFTILLCSSFLLSAFTSPAKAADIEISKFEGDWEMVYTVDVNNVSESQKNKLMETLADKWSIRQVNNPGGKRLILNSIDITSNINPSNGKLEFEYDYTDYKYKFVAGISEDGKLMEGSFLISRKSEPDKEYIGGKFVTRNTSKLAEQSKVDTPVVNSLDGLWNFELTVTKWKVSKETIPAFANGTSTGTFNIKDSKIIPREVHQENIKYNMVVEGNRIAIENYLYNESSTVLLTYKGQINRDMNRIEGNFLWQIKSSDETQYNTWLEADWTALKVQATGINSTGEGNKRNEYVSNDNPFIPQPVSDEDAKAAAAASGFLAGLSALISTIASMVGGTENLAGMPLPDANVTYPADTQKTTSFSGPDISRAARPSNHDAPVEPPVGTRREDGRIFTKNHGWQNENYPEMNINSIKNIISSLDNDIQRHIQNGDKLRTEIARDELKRNLRELKSWQEDNAAVKRAQTFESEDSFQNSAKRWVNHAGELETAANVAGAIGFASDIALAVGTSGISTALTSAKTTLSSLSLAKEIAGAAADGYVNNKNLSVVITEFGINKGISVGVGKIFDAGKAKYDVENAKNALKALVGAAESSAATVAQTAAQESGLTGKISGAVDAADNHFKGVAQGLNGVVKGGNGK